MYGSRQFATYDQGWVGWFVEKALEKKVAIVPGSNFAIDQSVPCNTFRLNYSSASKADITEAVKRLGEVLDKLL